MRITFYDEQTQQPLAGAAILVDRRTKTDIAGLELDAEGSVEISQEQFRACSVRGQKG